MIQRLPVVCWLVVVCSLSSLQGCSVLFIDRVPDNYADNPAYTCTSNRPVAGIDAAVAAFYGTLSVALFVVAADGGFGSEEATPLAVSMLIPALVTGGSAAHGFVAASECENAMDARDQHFRRAYARRVSLAQPQGDPVSCGSDAQCPGAQLCVAQRCVEPPPQAATPTAPAETTPTPTSPAETPPASVTP